MAELSRTGVREVNFDGLVGPTHNYAGLSFGNVASMRSAGAVSSPRRAAIQGLAKMRRLHDLGLTQGVFPPPRRPDPQALSRLGLGTSDRAAALAALQRQSDVLLAAVMSASPMWAANAATVSPSVDTADGRVHFTPANLVTTLHRSFEAPQTTAMLRRIFDDEAHFMVHEALPATPAFADEGAANHNRVCTSHGEPGIEIFVFGADEQPGRFPRRQSRLAAETIARSHGLDPSRVQYLAQSPTAIDAGAFHNDVVAVANESVVLAHAEAFANPLLAHRLVGEHAVWIEVGEQQVPLADAISSYLFNSQLVTVADGSMLLVAPAEAADTPSTAAYLDHLVAADNPIEAVEVVDLRESMRNGGGPACLRLRVILSDAELAALSGRVIVDAGLLDDLEDWVERHYRDELAPSDLGDPDLVAEVDVALDALEQLLELPGLYSRQL